MTMNSKSRYLPESLKYVSEKDDYYPVEYNRTVYDTFSLRVTSPAR